MITTNNLTFEILTKDNISEMFSFSTYVCFGLLDHDKRLMAISSGWITVRFYSRKQLEVDNVGVHEDYRSQGIGDIFFQHIENWALANHCKTIELNTYVQNSGSHKFYFKNNYSILGFHFQKKLK